MFYVSSAYKALAMAMRYAEERAEKKGTIVRVGRMRRGLDKGPEGGKGRLCWRAEILTLVTPEDYQRAAGMMAGGMETGYRLGQDD